MFSTTAMNDPAFRLAFERTLLGARARNSEALWLDARLLAQQDGAGRPSARHVREASALQTAIAGAVAAEVPSARRRSSVAPKSSGKASGVKHAAS